MERNNYLHSGTVVGKFEGEREITIGFVDLIPDNLIAKDRSRGIYLEQELCSMPLVSGGIQVWHMPALVEIFGDNAFGACANQEALEDCIPTRNKDRDLTHEEGDVIRAVTRWSPEFSTTCKVWKEIKFEFDTVDKLSVKIENFKT